MKKKEGRILELETALPFRYKLLIFLTVFLLAVTVSAVFLETRCKIKNFNVTGNTWYTDEEISNALRTSYFDKYSVFFKLHYMFKGTPEMAFVDKISVKCESADTVNVRVYETNIVGCVYEMGDYLYFDKDGYVVSSRSEQLNDVPRIEGLAYKNLAVNQKIEVQSDRLFGEILDVTQLISKNQLKIETISFDSSENITLYCTDKNVVYIGKQQSYDAIIQALPGILAAAEEKTAIYRLDMSEFTPENTTFRAEFIENHEDGEATGDGNGADGAGGTVEDDGSEEGEGNDDSESGGGDDSEGGGTEE